ncbi:uncharacterized protein (TIGR02284 family) [Pedobacter sp. UYP24]
MNIHQNLITMENTSVNQEILNDLIQINNDRVVGYQKAIDELKVEDNDLKSIFVEMIGQSHTHKAALAQEVQVLGADADSSTTTSGKIYRAWMDLKAVFTGHDRETVLNNCEFGEDAAQKAYKMALETEGLSADLRSLITEQKADLRTSHDQIKALRDEVAN